MKKNHVEDEDEEALCHEMRDYLYTIYLSD
jgi:hypothetical protein